MSLISRKCLILSKHAQILKPLFTVPKNTFFKEFEVKLERFNLVKKEYERKNLSLGSIFEVTKFSSINH